MVRSQDNETTVVGGGLMGRLMALALARRGERVILHEAGSPEGQSAAAFAAAAMLAPDAESMEAEPCVVALGRESLRLWPALLQSLPEPVFFQAAGTLVIWHHQDRDQAQYLSRILGKAPEGPKRLSAAELSALEPALGGRFLEGLYLPGEGQLDNRALLKSLSRALAEAGVDLRWGSPVEPSAITEGWVIDCRGLGARGDWRGLRGVRGEVLRVKTPEVTLHRPVRLLHPRYPLYVAPKPDGVFVVGATQIESEDESPTSVRSALELLTALYTVHPGFAEARIVEMSAQCRPTLPGHAPQIRWRGGRRLEINGLYRHGYLVAPAVLAGALAFIDQLRDNPSTARGWCEAAPWPTLYHWSEAA